MTDNRIVITQRINAVVGLLSCAAANSAVVGAEVYTQEYISIDSLRKAKHCIKCANDAMAEIESMISAENVEEITAKKEKA